jgi:hypothetical protein
VKCLGTLEGAVEVDRVTCPTMKVVYERGGGCPVRPLVGLPVGLETSTVR